MLSECSNEKATCSCVLCLIKLLENHTKGTPDPAALQIVAEFGCDPFFILVSCILSLRTRDSVSLAASRALFKNFKTPYDFVQASLSDIEKLIFSVGFYKRKAFQVKKLSQQLIQKFDRKVPSTEKELMSLKGVGRKTANLVLGIAFGIPAICVDTHVHRLANQWGLVSTSTPEETESELKKIIPKKFWIKFNELMVRWGQFKCKANSKICIECFLLNRVCSKAKKITRT